MKDDFRSGMWTGDTPPAAGKSAPEDDLLLGLATVQRADGSWELTAALAGWAGIDPDRLAQQARMLPGDPDLACRAAATALALHLLERNLADRADEWRLLAQKARRWLDRLPLAPPAPGGWLAWIRSLLASGC